MKKIYIVVSNTPTILAKTIRSFLKTEYSHVSLSFDKECTNMISFGRKIYWYPFIGGLVDEGKSIGFFKHFRNSKITVFEKEITDDQFIKVEELVLNFKRNRKNYDFNIIGLLTVIIKKPYGKFNEFFCSQFVAHLLKESGIHDFGKDVRIVIPMDFSKIPNTRIIYKGKFCNY